MAYDWNESHNSNGSAGTYCAYDANGPYGVNGAHGNCANDANNSYGSKGRHLKLKWSNGCSGPYFNSNPYGSNVPSI